MRELYYGAYRSERVEHNLHLVDGLLLEVIDFDRDDARESGAIRAELAARGQPSSLPAAPAILATPQRNYVTAEMG
ncbi:hypothetical protein BH23GEM3_BH23GEM3_00200 [soil metagenome]